LWKYAVAAPFWWDKLRVWFMPAGWIPRGLEKKEKPSITVENQVKFRPPMFANARIYMILQVVLGIALMLGIISNLYGWSGPEKWLAAALLWWQIINWSGILEGKAWLWLSEIPRNLVTLMAIVACSELYRPSLLLAGLIAITFYTVLWTFAYFRPKAAQLVTVS
jgi:alkylglycerol monooxygenase